MLEASPRLYVGNLPYVAQKADIERLFAENELLIKKIDISIDPFTGRNPSYCFVDFYHPDDADRAMQTLQGRPVRGRPVKINLKTERNHRHARAPVHTGSHDGTGLASANVYVYDRWSRDDAESHWTAPIEQGRRLYVSGLPKTPHQSLVNAQMRVLFQGLNIEAVSKILPPPEYKLHLPGSHYYCFVDLPTAREAEDAVFALDGKKTPHGGTYKVMLGGTPQSPIKVMREQLGVEDPSRSPRRNLQGCWRRQG